MKPLAESIAEAGLELVAVSLKGWGEAEARALGFAFSGHALKRLHLRGIGRSLFGIDAGDIYVKEGFLPALATALPALEVLSLSRANINGNLQMPHTSALRPYR